MKKCKKVQYDTKRDAEAKIPELLERYGRDLRAHRCQQCKGKFHLTTMNESEYGQMIGRINLRVKAREEKFINQEAEFWLKRFGTQ